MRPTEPFRTEHAELRAHIEHLREAAGAIPGLSIEDRETLLGRIVDFLRGTLIPHAKAEEDVFYPAWAELVGFDQAAAPMVHDHQAIVSRIEQLEQTEPADTSALQELLYGLHALIGVHFRKEEDIQLPAFDAAPPEVTRKVLDHMAALSGHAHDVP